jgi:hypothetical protein
MRLEHTAGILLNRLIRRFLWRVAIVLLIAASAIVAIYQFTIAGSLALEAHYDVIHVRLAVGAIYAGFVLLGLAVLWTLRQRQADSSPNAGLVNQREVRLVMLLEALMLGYTLARKPDPKRSS